MFNWLKNLIPKRMAKGHTPTPAQKTIQDVIDGIMEDHTKLHELKSGTDDPVLKKIYTDAVGCTLTCINGLNKVRDSISK